MSTVKNTSAGSAWTKPELQKLGAIKDVAGAATVNNNGANPNVKS